MEISGRPMESNVFVNPPPADDPEQRDWLPMRRFVFDGDRHSA